MINSFKRSVKDFFLRPLFEKFKIGRLSRPSLNNLDDKLENYLNFNGGTFLEIGANDGFKQSNTYYLERIKDWRGILIEPIPFLFEECKKKRPKSEVFNFICDTPSESGETKIIHYADLMSQVKGALENPEDEINHLEKARVIQQLEATHEIKIACKTLSEIIDSSSYESLDFMSIDVEGYEFQVLQGLDLFRHLPTYILVETWSHEERKIKEYLDSRYKIESYLTKNDILFKLKL